MNFWIYAGEFIMQIRYAIAKDFDSLVKMAKYWSDLLSYRHLIYVKMRKDIKAKHIIIAEEENEVLGFCEFNPLKRKYGQATIGNIAVKHDKVGKGIGFQLFSFLNKKYPLIKLKCVKDIEANKSYKRWGGKVIGVERKKNKRTINIWGFKREIR